MSRVARMPVPLPKGVELTQAGGKVRVKGPKGELSHTLNSQVEINVADGTANITSRTEAQAARAIAGTTRALLANMVNGVSKGFERKLELVGVGYRAQAQGKKLNLTLGFSHPVAFAVPDGITIDTPSQTEIVIKGADKHKVGQVAADIRRYRPPEPYKGKGVRYAGEKVVLKEAKKK
ncbi:MAG: 50S ribosomal protein L6 [Gammaproteobacteria bacterium]|nr:50S ribosomal protein L6 [Gammaproteobacteria bacterium]